MREQEGDLASRKLVDNPFIGVVIQERYAAGQYSAAVGLLARVFTINAGYLAMGAGNLKWIADRRDDAEARIEEQDTEYDEKKYVVFRHPKLFEALMRQLQDVYGGLEGRFKNKGSMWATHVRNLCYVTMLTLYPLRVTNHAGMKLPDNFDPVTHRIRFAKGFVKNKKAIDFELPSAGPFAWVRQLVELYVDDARPVLLRGAESAYFFVSDHSVPHAQGARPRQAFNDALITFSDNYLAGVFPAELGTLIDERRQGASSMPLRDFGRPKSLCHLETGAIVWSRCHAVFKRPGPPGAG